EETGAWAFVLVYGGDCVMNKGVVLQKNDAEAVAIETAVRPSTFTMNGGTIRDNTSSSGYGSGVSLYGTSSGAAGVFTMNGGAISGNTNTSLGYGGGGVFVNAGFSDVEFTMNGGTISGNTTVGDGGGVFVNSSGGGSAVFTMNGGTISGNGADGSGGGVYVENTSVGGSAGFTMKGGTIRSNTATYGGGVSIGTGANITFKKSGGTIYGSNGGANSNTATPGLGDAAYVSADIYRNTTAGPGVVLDSGSIDNWGE
ncbi:MAG: hypothetical protein FWG35_07315, partial [Spirochaetaceae bacterium]|nr:hypothetical protein [Spirochaetaceae bacterium]